MARVDELNIYRKRDLSLAEDVYKEIEEKAFDYKEFINDYFKPMDISEKQREERRKLANEMFNVFLFLFSLVEVSQNYNYLNVEYLVTQFELQYAPLVMSYSRNDEYISGYVDKVSKDIVNTTVDNVRKPKDSGENKFATSDKRAALLSVNEANSVENYEELQEAIENGYTKKSWCTMLDRKVRDTHRVLEGKTIPIDEYFEVGDDLLLFPRDEENCINNLGNIANCRCSLKFS